MLDLTIGEETVDGILLVIENFEDRGELGHDEQLDAAPGEIQQPDLAAGFVQRRVAHHQSAQASAIHIIDFRHVENDATLAGIDQCLHGFAIRGHFAPDGHAAIEVENGDAFAVSFVDLEAHGVASAIRQPRVGREFFRLYTEAGERRRFAAQGPKHRVKIRLAS